MEPENKLGVSEVVFKFHRLRYQWGEFCHFHKDG